VVKMAYNPPKSAAGYCRLHKWKLSYRQIRRLGCISTRKQRGGKEHCFHLQKFYEHPVWVERSRRREERKAAQK